jgi:hypothetical protein
MNKFFSETSKYLRLPLFLSLFVVSSCAQPGDPYYQGNSGYRDPYYNSGGYNDDYYRNERDRDRLERDRRKVDSERRRLEDERRDLERERDANRYTPPPPPVVREERCPSGFSPSEQKCSREERQRGCKDMRLPGGLGCVRR